MLLSAYILCNILSSVLQVTSRTEPSFSSVVLQQPWKLGHTDHTSDQSCEGQSTHQFPFQLMGPEG